MSSDDVTHDIQLIVGYSVTRVYVPARGGLHLDLQVADNRDPRKDEAEIILAKSDSKFAIEVDNTPIDDLNTLCKTFGVQYDCSEFRHQGIYVRKIDFIMENKSVDCEGKEHWHGRMTIELDWERLGHVHHVKISPSFGIVMR
mmetsp:Transcript_18109/g.30175  ORF Transcript_18109/g.30175 Transcript_18109/m.30175 type:complete len:143 (+) Transcript_18109:84-512(+)